MIALGELGPLGRIECELLGCLVRYVTSGDRRVDDLSGSVHADLYHHFSFLLEVFRGLREVAFDTSSG